MVPPVPPVKLGGLWDPPPAAAAAAAGAARASRWSDGPPPAQGPPSAQDSRDRRPSPGLDPPAKKFRPEPTLAAIPRAATGPDGYGPGPDGFGPDAFGSDPGVGDPGLPYGRSTAVSAGAPAAGVAGGLSTQSYGGGPHSYGSGQSYGTSTYASAGSQLSTGFAPGSAKGTGALFYKTKLCTKFMQGGCTFNERCNFAHGQQDLRKPPVGWEDMVASAKEGGMYSDGGAGRTSDAPRRKTNKPCRFFVAGSCPYGERCTFLHGDEEPQRTPGLEPFGGGGMRGPNASRANYKTRMCSRWDKGEHCNFGDKCHFAHGVAELQRYSGASTYSSNELPYPSAKLEVPPSAAYSDPSMMNAPPAVNPYGAGANYPSTGGPGANFNPYAPTAGADQKAYGNVQDASGGPPGNFNYWDTEKTWQGANVAPAQSSIPNQGYAQTNQGAPGAPWMASYPTDGGYSSTQYSHSSQYPQETAQSQPQSGSFYSGVNEQKQNFNTNYVQSNYQNEVPHGDGPYYQGAYNGAGHPGQQTDNSGRYNTAEAWAGKM